MRKEDCRTNMPVVFGRPNGEKTRGVVIKLNPKKAKVKITEDRGRRSEAGAVWGVPYSMMEPDGEMQARGDAVDEVVKFVNTKPYEPIPNIISPIDAHIVRAISQCYLELSPENLTCDGELPPALVRRKRAELERKLKGLFAAFGREVDELQAYEWCDTHQPLEARV